MDEYDVVIVGGGVIGTAILYTLSLYSDVGSILLIEKNTELSSLNSNSRNNSQTIHFGDIETNYTVEKAKVSKAASEMLVNYLESMQRPDEPRMYVKKHKMLLGVGKEEVRQIKKRFEEFRELFPHNTLASRKEIASLEPEIVKGRKPDEELAAIVSRDGYIADYAEISRSFVREALKGKTKKITILADTKLESITREAEGYALNTTSQRIRAKSIAVAAGAHSIYFAKSLGYGQDKVILPFAGNFYPSTRKFLNGKVYTIINPKLPFAAIHGDANIHNPDQTKFGPTAYFLPVLERHNQSTFSDYLHTLEFDTGTLKVIYKLIFDWDRFEFALLTLAYSIPLFGKYLFLQTVRKIVPSAKSSEIYFHKDWGGMRPQIADKKTGEFVGGTGTVKGDKIIFLITPSPGATACIQIAEDVAKSLTISLGRSFYQERFDKILRKPRNG
jgi:malate dehydrogenase (quinone)